ncbi:hypothetical protein [Rhizobium laguerreae]|uniref:hypothetical protein n=1 Tax=Rhizobium laguerreae TaxID=1076926 RepID=UPI0014415B70|nr:hypothetical protein [Rhizobium laguerreae]NKN09527.1 hypothetical protein [Rhizobium laguerreae]
MEKMNREQLTQMLSRAVHRWFRYYGLERDNYASQVLCNAALEFYNEGYRSEDDIATILIGTYVGVDATKINAPTSAAVH